MNCREFKNNLSLLARAELEGDARDDAARHARECADCGRQLREGRALEETVRQAAEGDATRAAAALEGFEDRLLERRRRGHAAAALAPRPPRRPAWRLAFGLSLGLNLCVGAALLALLGLPDTRTRLLERLTPARTLPAGLPSPARMVRVFDEMETFYGRRLNWVSESGGQMAMGIISDPDAVPAPGQPREPLVALVYWLDAAGGGQDEKHLNPVVIMTRSGREIREQVPLGPGRAPIEIAVNSFRPQRGRFAIQTRVQPLEPMARAGESFSSLAAAVSVAPGKPTKLGEVRLGNRIYETYLAVQVLGGVTANDTNS